MPGDHLQATITVGGDDQGRPRPVVIQRPVDVDLVTHCHLGLESGAVQPRGKSRPQLKELLNLFFSIALGLRVHFGGGNRQRCAEKHRQATRRKESQ